MPGAHLNSRGAGTHTHILMRSSFSAACTQPEELAPSVQSNTRTNTGRTTGDRARFAPADRWGARAHTITHTQTTQRARIVQKLNEPYHLRAMMMRSRALFIRIMINIISRAQLTGLCVRMRRAESSSSNKRNRTEWGGCGIHSWGRKTMTVRCESCGVRR